MRHLRSRRVRTWPTLIWAGSILGVASMALSVTNTDAPPTTPTRDLVIRELRTFSVVHLVLPTESPDRVEFALPIGGQLRTITAERRSLRGPGFRVLLQNERHELVAQPVPPVRTYRGVVDGDESLGIAIQLVDGALRGLFDLGELGVFFVQPRQ